MKAVTLLALLIPSLGFSQVKVETRCIISTNYYVVTASSMRAALRTAEAERKQKKDPSYAFASLSFWVAWDRLSLNTPPAFSPTRKTYYLEAEITLPKFEGPFTTNKVWMDFEKELLAHENEHVNIARQYLEKMAKTSGQIECKTEETKLIRMAEEEHVKCQERFDQREGIKMYAIYSKLWNSDGGGEVRDQFRPKTLSGLRDISEIVSRGSGVERSQSVTMGTFLQEQGWDPVGQKNFVARVQEQMDLQVSRLREGLATGQFKGDDAERAVEALGRIKRLGRLHTTTTLEALQKVTIDEKGTKLIESPSRGGSGM